MSTPTRTGTCAIVALAGLALACHGRRTTEVERGWFKLEREEPREVLPHMVGVGQKRTHVYVKAEGRWELVDELDRAGPAVEYGGGFALVPAMAGGRRYLLGLRADGRTRELPACDALAVDAARVSAACARCRTPCTELEITTYVDPLAKPVQRKLPVPGHVCAGGVALVDGKHGKVGWYRESGHAGVRLQCTGPTGCAYLDLTPAGLVPWGRRDEPCP